MKVHEYQARELLQNAGVPVPAGVVIEQPQDANAAFERLSAPQVVVKAQVHAGGRGKAGYVKLVTTAKDAAEHAQRMFREPMVNNQTGPEGVTVRRILFAPAVDIDHEYYVGVVVDRTRRVPVMMASAEGGVEIEEVAEKNPDAIKKAWFDPHLGLTRFQALRLAKEIGLSGEQAKTATDAMLKLARLFIDKDCSLAEINPLVRTPQGEILAIDAKFNFDDNAVFRHEDIQSLFDPSEENAAELEAKRHNLSYIALDGNIGCLVNGAGLAMATMDMIKLHGGEPANFLDVGGGVTTESAIEAFKIILADEQVQAVLVNIFGGIAKCDVIAEALIEAAKQIGFRVPVVVRLEGTNVEKARQMLQEANVDKLISAKDLTDAAKRVTASV